MKKGVLLALFAYTFWGFFPVYWKQLLHVASPEIAAHRVFWSFILLVVFLLMQGKLKNTFSRIRKSPNKFLLVFPSLLIGTNWFLYVWAVNAGFIIETSLGYFISPLLSVFLGVFILHEHLRRLQWLAISIAAIGVLIMTIVYGQFPWIALYLAGSWSIYGLLRKKSEFNGPEGLALDSAILSIPILGYLLFLLVNGNGSFLYVDIQTNFLLIGCGVMTVLPLTVFITASRLIELSLIGIISYIYPAILLLVGVFLYDETLTQIKLIGFIFIWIALIIYSLEGVMFRRRKQNPRI
ncbi:MAG: EamA family transporter RarD [Bacteroidetes bacterium]|nr:EamA family transporter RarD [Bacteroidota bacterium]